MYGGLDKKVKGLRLEDEFVKPWFSSRGGGGGRHLDIFIFATRPVLGPI